MKVFNKDKALRQIKLKQNKNTYIKKVSIVLSCFILIIVIIMFTFAKFEQNSEEYTLINGKIKYLGGDINIVSYNYDGTSNSLPPNKNEGYILTNINCEGATGEWDDLNWELNISNLTSKVKCNLTFDKNSNYQIIKYNPNGGYLEEQYKKGVVGQQIGELPTPIKAGYTFDGWYKEETYTNKVENTTIIDSSLTNLYAKYSESGDNRILYVFGYASSGYYYNIYKNTDNSYKKWYFEATAGVVYDDENLSIRKGQYHVHTITFKKDAYYMDLQHYTEPIFIQAGNNLSYNSPSMSTSVIIWFE